MNIRICEISKIYYGKNGLQQTAVKDFSCEFTENGFYIVTGESGCGKTTLLNLIGGLDRPTAGSILFDERNLQSFSETEWEELRNLKIGYIFQNYALIEEETIRQNLEKVIDIREQEEKHSDIIANALSLVELDEDADKRVCDLSGGQKQRVAIARAVLKKPDLILADEPTGNLDSNNSDLIFRILKKLAKHSIVIVVTHDSKRSKLYADRELQLADGTLIRDITLKSHENDSYTIILNGENQGAFRQKEEAMSCLQKVIDCGDENEIAIYYSAAKKQEESGDEPSGSLKEVRKLTLRDRLRYLFENLSDLSVRDVILNICIILSLLVALVGFSVCINDYTKPIKKYYSDNNGKAIVSLDYSGTARHVTGTFFNNGEILRNQLWDAVGKENTFGILEGLELSTDDFSLVSFEEEEGTFIVDDPKETDSVSVYLQFKDSSLAFLTGKEPNSGDAIAITDYLADKLKLSETNVGEKLFLGGEWYTLSGIVQTDYEEYNPDLHIKMTDEYSEEAEYLRKIKYAVVYVDPGYLEAEKAGVLEKELCINVNGFDILNSNNVYKYTDNTVKIGVLDTLQSGDTVNIQISEEYAEDNGFSETSLPKTVTVNDLYHEKYSNAYYDELNLYNLVGGEVTIVGICEDASADIYVDRETYTSLVNTLYDAFYFDYYGVYLKNGSVDETVDALTDAEFKFRDPNIRLVYEWQLVMSKYRYIIGIITVLMFAVAIGLCVIKFLFVMKLNRKKIGILRIVGFEGGNIRNLYVTSAMYTFFMSYLLAIVGGTIFLHVFNRKIAAAEQLIRALTMYALDYIVCGACLIGIGCALLGIYCAVIRKCLRANLVDLVRL